MKNYLIAIGLVVAAVLLTVYGFAWYNVLKEGKVSQSYLVKTKVISNTCHPVWNEQFILFCEPNETIQFQVMDRDLTSKDDQCGLFVPAKKGDAVGIWYTNFALTGSTDRFRFVYAEGEI